MADQMVQAARSGRQNIAEGSRASATSSQTELPLINVARSSLEELLLDYEDYLRHRHLRQWPVNHPQSLAIRQIYRQLKDPSDVSDPSKHYALYAQWLDNEDSAIRANALLCLINQPNYLLDTQISALEHQFIDDGGYSEQLAAARLAKRANDKKDRSDQSDPADLIPPCPQCRMPMVLRTAQKGTNMGKQFWGCSNYPDCKGIVQI